MAATWAYFDTSALVKRYISEPGSLQVGQLLRRHEFLSSAITPVELLSGLSRRRRGDDLSEPTFVALLRRIQLDRSRWELVEVGSLVLNRAEELVQGNLSLKTLDAIHVASLVTFQTASGKGIPFITGDGRQRDAATQLGLNLIWVG
ncbi:MAG TPA: type II toxin-antitoxin system VapC family toxin [Candidatus Binatia bacterium]|nr:type II toxin-antitoxin system VapC family toxin [Candidatus Binatia bacterium]